MTSRVCLAATVLMSFTAVLFADKMELPFKIVDRQSHDTNYAWFVPALFTSQSNGGANCFATASTANCSASSVTTGTATPARSGSFNVKGATFSLQLRDGRIAVVNCDSKFAERFAGRAGNHRDCRVPLVDELQAEFDGDKARLKWPVSLDGKKIESETYKILKILAKP